MMKEISFITNLNLIKQNPQRTRSSILVMYHPTRKDISPHRAEVYLHILLVSPTGIIFTADDGGGWNAFTYDVAEIRSYLIMNV